MAETATSQLLRPGLLAGQSVVLAGAGGALGVAPTIGAALAELGAEVHACELICSGEPEPDDAQVEAVVSSALAGHAGVQALVVDAGGFLASTGGRAGALVAALEATWRMTRAVANAAFIPGGGGGRIAYLAPPAVESARAGLENLARTLSIEWARYGITPVSIASGPHTSADELAGIVAYLLSPAGAYFSGCQLDLRGPGAATER